ncbi:MAG: Rrf2 family transcriptional regulator [Oscillospiraceae bacterium]|nr:Rrf2 family transcriptional regulator [Oscillospiraceae bacterium]
MQLRRDTDYAVRILFCIKEDYDRRKRKGSGLTLSEIAAHVGIPKLVAGRLCERLSAGGIIKSKMEQESEEKIYYTTDGLSSKSLLDVIEVMEETGKIFAVFDKRSSMYKSCEDSLQQVQSSLENVLKGTALKELFTVGKK